MAQIGGIELANVTKRFGDTLAIDSVSMIVPPGTIGVLASFGLWVSNSSTVTPSSPDSALIVLAADIVNVLMVFPGLVTRP